MAIKLFHLKSKARSPASHVVFSQGIADRLSSFLFDDTPIPERALTHIVGKAQSGLQPHHVPKLDYLSGLGAFHLVSSKFIDHTSKALGSTVSYFPVSVIVSGDAIQYFLIRVNLRLHLINFGYSSETTNQMPAPPTVFLDSIDTNFLLAREIEKSRNNVVMASEEFTRICEQSGLGISFREAITSY